RCCQIIRSPHDRRTEPPPPPRGPLSVLPDAMTYYAHTAELPDGSRDPDRAKWQPLADHLRNVAELAARFAAPFGASDEARLAGLLHDLGKYRLEFQAYLRGERSSSAETQHAVFGAAWAADER